MPLVVAAMLTALLVSTGAVSAQSNAELNALNAKSKALFEAGKHEEAIPFARRYADGVGAVFGRESKYYALSLVLLAQRLERARRSAEAEPPLRQSIAIFEKNPGSDKELIVALDLLADVYDALNRTEEALPLLQRAVALQEKISDGNNLALARRNNRLTLFYIKLGRFAEAYQVIRRSSDIFRANVTPEALPDFANYLHSYAYILKELHQYAPAETFMRQALEINEKLYGADSVKVARSLNSLGEILSEMNRNEEAEPLIRRSLAIITEKDGRDSSELIAPLNNLAAILSETGRTADAERFSRAALRLKEMRYGPDHPETALGMNTLGKILTDAGKFEESAQVGGRALAIIEKKFGPQHIFVALYLNNSAMSLLQLKRFDEAEALSRRALAIYETNYGKDHSVVADCLANLASILVQQHRYAEAVEMFRRAKPAMTDANRANELQNAGTGKAALEKRRGFLVSYVRALHHDNAASIDNRNEAFEVAQWAMQNSAAEALSAMSARFSKGDEALAKLIREQQDLLTESGTAARLLTAALSQGDRVASDTARKTIASVRLRLEQKQAELRQTFPNYADLAFPSPAALPAVQSRLADNQALVLFIDQPLTQDTAPETVVFALTRTNARWHVIEGGSRETVPAVVALRCGLDGADWRDAQKRARCKTLLDAEAEPNGLPPFDARIAHDLYKRLFGPVEDLIEGKSLLIVPSGILTQLPFEVLLTEKPDESLPRFESYRTAAWFGQKHPITVLPAVTALKAAPISKAAKAYIGFGNPLLTGADGKDRSAWAKQSCAGATNLVRTSSLPANPAVLLREGGVNVEALRRQTPLPETADELCAAARTMGIAEKELDRAVYLGERATVSQIKALSKTGDLSRAHVVHFATHGLIAGQTALFAKTRAEPALLFTPPAANKVSDDDNGLLTASEAAQLKLDADWVVLSACNTAAGSNDGAEALSGLARAFFYAGARSLLVSHWEVDSEAAVAIATGAVSAMQTDPAVNRAGAVQRATAALMSRGGANAHPSVWAPFALVGTE